MNQSVSTKKAQEPMGVIDSFSAGIAVVARHPELLLLPLLLDLFLWLGPSLTVGPSVIESVVTLFDPQAASAAEFPDALETDLALLHETARAQLEGLNLWSFLVLPFLFWPTVAAGTPVEATARGMMLDNVGNLLLVALGLLLVGLFLNMVWLDGVARGVRGRPWWNEPGRALRRALRQSLRFLAILLLLLATLFGVLIPISVVIAFMTLMAPGIGQALATLLTLGLTWVIVWVAFHLYFTAGGVVLHDLGVLKSLGSSIRLVRQFFWSAFWFVVLSVLLSMGFQLIWAPLRALSAAGYATSIVGNAALGTAIVAAMFIFYRERVVLLEDESSLDNSGPGAG